VTFTLSGSHAVVTGASKGIGHQLARELASRDVRVTVVARSDVPLKALADEINGTAVIADLSNADDVDGLMHRIEVENGPVDLLINNAAVALVDRLVDQAAADIRASWALNCVAPAELTRQVLGGMLERGRGRVTNISSIAGITALPTLTTYGGTKAGLTQFTAALQRELRRTPVRVTIVQLGEVAGTDMIERARRSPTIAAISKRFARMKAMPTITTATVARKIVDATVAGRRNSVVPRRMSSFHTMGELPSRLNDLLMVGIE
jgi:uncharacterized protein